MASKKKIDTKVSTGTSAQDQAARLYQSGMKVGYKRGVESVKRYAGPPEHHDDPVLAFLRGK